MTHSMSNTMRYTVEVMWNREFHYTPRPQIFTDLTAAEKYALEMKDSGDGERVKEARVVDQDGNVVIPSYLIGRRPNQTTCTGPR
jgi:hypothetical protein